MPKNRYSGNLLQIAELGSPVIRTPAKDVENIKSREIQHHIDDLIATLYEIDGVGIASPQIYKFHRIFILASHPNPRYPDAPLMKPKAIINPKIISKSTDKNKDWEGCLSVPGIRALVPRHDIITVEYQNRSGGKEVKEFEGFIARIFQHEYDHLDGIVFIDRCETPKDIITEKEYKKLMNNSSEDEDAEEEPGNPSEIEIEA